MLLYKVCRLAAPQLRQACRERAGQSQALLQVPDPVLGSRLLLRGCVLRLPPTSGILAMSGCRRSGTKPDGLLHVSRAAATAACTVAVREFLVGWSCSFTALLGTLMLRRACTPCTSCILQLVNASGARSISPLCGMAGDVVVGLNGRPITKGSDLIGAMDTLEDGQTVRTWPLQDCLLMPDCRFQLLHV